MTPSRPRSLAAAALVGLALLAGAVGCGSDDDSSDVDDTTTTAAAAAAGGASGDEGSGGGSDDGGTATVPRDLPLDTVANAIEVAMDPERVEIDGDTLHVYLPENGGGVPTGTECTVILSVLPDDATAVVHRGDEEFTC